MPLLEIEESKIRLNPHMRYVFLVALPNGQRLPILFSEDREAKLPEASLEFEKYAENVILEARLLGAEKIFLRISRASLRRVSSNPRLYVPSDVIAVLTKGGKEIALMPSHGGVYVEVRGALPGLPRGFHMDADNVLEAVKLLSLICL